MLARLRRTATVFAAVLAAYLVYALVVVPFVEPTVRLAKKKRRPFPVGENRAKKLEQLFPEGSWELGRCKILEVDQGTLLFDDYAPSRDGKLKLNKCTVVAYIESEAPPGSQDDSSERRRPVIIRAAQGATLNFDELDVTSGKFGDLRGGQLDGEVTIHSPPSSAAGNDTLHLATRNVQIGLQKIWTPHEVRFQYGPNHGSGRGLTILLANITKGSDSDVGLGIGGVRSLELDHLDRMELLLQNQGLFGKEIGAGQKHDATKAASPVIVECSGPLRFDVDRQLISLERDVRLSRLHRNGPADQLQCEKLEIHFTSNMQASKTGKLPDSSLANNDKLVPTRVVATGSPVTVRAGAFGMGAQAERLEYDCKLQRVWLHDSEKVLLNDPHRRMEAKELRYTLGENNRLGELWAQGPGTVRGVLGDSARSFEMRWRDKVHLQRIGGEPVLSFNEKAEMTVAELGAFVGDTVHLYLREKPRPGKTDSFETTVDRLHAIGHVQIDSPNCRASLREAKIWFKEEEPAAGSLQPPSNEEPSLVTLPTDQNKKTLDSKFELRAQTVEAVVFMGRQRTAVDLLIVKGDLELRELADPSVPPLLIRGNHFELQRGASEHPLAALVGSPAEIRARGMAAQGPKLHLYPADNLVEIVGAGELKPTGEMPTASSQSVPPIHIQWSGRMQFDGSVARFEDNVTVKGSKRLDDGNLTNFVATGDAVNAELSEPIDFRRPGASTATVKEVAFDGWGFLQADVFDALNERKLFQQMQVLGLSVDQISGEIRGLGPGWLRGIHRSGDFQAFQPGLPASTVAKAPHEDKSSLVFLRVDFERELAGNLHEQRIDFLHGTRTLYGPVQSWDEALDQENVALPESAVRVTCDRLTVSQFGQGRGDTVELEAVGNTHIQGATFTATGGRASYVRQKDQFVLEGDGRNDARVEIHTPSGGRPSNLAAGKILFWPKTGQCKMDDVSQTELFDLGNLRGRGAPAVNRR